MHIKKIRIKNLLSFKDATFNFDKYNVIVGTNNSGKTNLIRILEKIIGNKDLSFIGLNQDSKFDKTLPTEIDLTLEFTNEEMKMVFQSIFGSEIKQTSFPDELRTIDVVINWEDTVKEEPYPNFISYRLQNGLTIISQGDNNIVFDSHLIFQNNEAEYQKMIDKYKHQSYNQFVKNIPHAYSLLENNTIGSDIKLFEACAKGESLEPYFRINKNSFTRVQLAIEYNDAQPTPAGSEVADYLDLNKQSTHRIKLSYLINTIIRKNFVTIKEIHPSYVELVNRLVELRNIYYVDYEELQKVFRDLTNGIQLRVAKRTPQGQTSSDEFILLEDNNKMYSLQESASGHYALIYILHSILNKPNCFIMIDEPEVHFHPILITQLNESLNKLALERNNQIVIISHSPKFVNYDLIDSAQFSRLISVIRTNDFSEVSSSSASFQPALKRHLFNPEVFFGKCSMIVEGSDDYFAMKAISDYHNGLFEKYNITLTHCWGLGNVPAMIEIHNEFKIPFLAMVDSDYADNMDNVVKLPQRLEEEYQKLGWSGSKVKDDAYPFMEELLKNGGLDKLKLTTLWPVFKQIITKVGGEIPKITS